jgi:plastocyanin
MKKIIVISSVLLLALVITGCGNQATNTNTSTATNNTNGTAAANAVTIQNFAFNPASLTVKAGTTVTWTNMDSTIHRIKSATFNSSDLNQGDTFQFQFNTPGTYNYSCAIHPSMQGTITVQ